MENMEETLLIFLSLIHISASVLTFYKVAEDTKINASYHSNFIKISTVNRSEECFGECMLNPTCHSFSFRSVTSSCVFYNIDRCSLNLISLAGVKYFDRMQITEKSYSFKLKHKSGLGVGYVYGLGGLRFRSWSSLSLNFAKCLMLEGSKCLQLESSMVKLGYPPSCSNFNLIPVGEYYMVQILQPGLCLGTASITPVDKELVSTITCNTSEDKVLFSLLPFSENLPLNGDK